MRVAYLFDLDGTLVNTEALIEARKNRDWKGAARRVAETSVYPGVVETLAAIQAHGAKIAVVTTSVSFYAAAVLKHHQLPYDTLVAYHDALPTKPAPGGYLLAMKRLEVTPDQALGIGDDEKDVLALRAAKVRCIGAAWNPFYHSDAEWDEIAQRPRDVIASIAG